MLVPYETVISLAVFLFFAGLALATYWPILPSESTTFPVFMWRPGLANLAAELNCVRHRTRSQPLVQHLDKLLRSG